MKYYITKYALTEGILEVDENETEIFEGYLKTKFYGLFVPARDWFTSLADAEIRVQQMVEAKLRSLEKSKKKLTNYRAVVKPLGKKS